METKRCKICEIFKEIDLFPKNNRGKYGVGHVCKGCSAEYSRQLRAAKPFAHAARKYKISEQEVESYWSVTTCEICKKEDIKPHIDHCHTTGKVRGVLCYSCNYGLGMFKDNITSLKEAIKYLEERNANT